MDQVKLNKTLNNDFITALPVEDFLQGVADGGAALIALIRRADLKLVYCNARFEQVLGYKKEEINKGILFTSFLEGNQHHRLETQLNSVTDNITARSSYLIYRLKNKNGLSLPFYLYASPVNLGQSGPNEYFHLLLLPDLSKWGMPFTSFETKELFLEQFTNEEFGTFEWINHVDKLYWSEGIYSIFGIDENKHDLNAKFVYSFIHPSDKIRVKEVAENAIKTGNNVNFEFRIITTKQKVRLLHIIASVIKNSKGGHVKFAGSIRDITDQRQIEENLKNKVAELYNSNKELEEFAYIASHDLQEPLRKITTFSDRLSDKYKDVLTGDGSMYLSRMIASAENMRLLINDLLNFSRISKTEQPFTQVNLENTLRQVISEFEVAIEETGTVINCKSLPEVYAVASQMKQLLGNLVSNAIKFRKPGTNPVINIESSVLNLEEKAKLDLLQIITWFKIEVTDNGIGFEDEYATRIFQVFQRLHGKSAYPGSGIGLAICKKILEYHHGIIYAENLPGIGARFVFILPGNWPNYKNMQNEHLI